jgi:hypothetical protein
MQDGINAVMISCYLHECTRENDHHKVKPALELEAPVIPWVALTCVLILRVVPQGLIPVDPVQYLAEDGRQWLQLSLHTN